MSAVVVITPASGSITHLLTVCRITCTGASTNTVTGYDSTAYPQEPAIVAHFRARLAGQSDLVSNTFSASRDGDGAWYDVIFPAAGTWVLTLRDSADSQLATANVVVA